MIVTNPIDSNSIQLNSRTLESVSVLILLVHVLMAQTKFPIIHFTLHLRQILSPPDIRSFTAAKIFSHPLIGRGKSVASEHVRMNSSCVAVPAQHRRHWLCGWFWPLSVISPSKNVKVNKNRTEMLCKVLASKHAANVDAPNARQNSLVCHKNAKVWNIYTIIIFGIYYREFIGRSWLLLTCCTTNSNMISTAIILSKRTEMSKHETAKMAQPSNI